MKIEHFAVNVSEPVKMAEWYVKHLGMEIISGMDKEPFMHFLGDKSGAVSLEIYKNTKAEIPDYKNMHPLIVHLAFVSQNPEQDKERLIAAGARFVEEVRPDDDSVLIMMRDPWGLAIQLCKRKKPKF